MNIMLIGSLDGYVSTAAKIALNQGAKVLCFDTPDAAFDALRKGANIEAIFLDIQCGVKAFAQSLTQERFHVTLIACGVKVTAEEAAQSIHDGAKEYIPFPPDAELIAAILTAVSRQDHTLLSQDPAMERWVRFAQKVAPSEASILITGESGTGKEVMARYIHEHSKRSHKPFIAVNCAAIPENLLESELFGHEKGSFTGAVARRIGKFEEASSGTLLLDEISEMHPRLQAKLLRAIQEKVIDRVGGSQTIPVNVRIIATSNRNLMEAIEAGEFREDLYFRLNVVNIQLPPLRERPLDIPVLAQHFMTLCANMNHMPAKPFAPESLTALQNAPFRGNVRELQNMIHRALLISESDMIRIEDLGLTQVSDENASVPESMVGKTVAEMERELILQTLDHCLGNRTHASHILGISIRTLRNKLKEYEHHSMHAGGDPSHHEHAYKAARYAVQGRPKKSSSFA